MGRDRYSKTELIAVEQPPIHPTAVYSVQNAAAHTNFCTKTILAAVKAGQIKACRKGRSVVILGKNLLAWLQNDETDGKEQVA